MTPNNIKSIKSPFSFSQKRLLNSGYINSFLILINSQPASYLQVGYLQLTSTYKHLYLHFAG